MFGLSELQTKKEFGVVSLWHMFGPLMDQESRDEKYEASLLSLLSCGSAFHEHYIMWLHRLQWRFMGGGSAVHPNAPASFQSCYAVLREMPMPRLSSVS
jgi:hypothetical protein